MVHFPIHNRVSPGNSRFIGLRRARLGRPDAPTSGQIDPVLSKVRPWLSQGRVRGGGAFSVVPHSGVAVGSSFGELAERRGS